MRIFFFAAVLIFCQLHINCASIHQGNYAIQPGGDELKGRSSKGNTTKSGLLISGKEAESYSSEYFSLIYFTFENKNQEWITIKKIILDFGDEKINKNIKFTSGLEYKNWAEATRTLMAIDENNKAVLLGAVTLLGYGMTGSRNESIQALGLATAMGGLVSLTADAFNKHLDSIQNAKIFPENHLFSGDFIIPPGLFAKKWILINSLNHENTGYLTSLNLTYVTDKGVTEKIKLIFREDISNSKWQLKAKPVSKGNPLYAQ